MFWKKKNKAPETGEFVHGLMQKSDIFSNVILTMRPPQYKEVSFVVVNIIDIKMDDVPGIIEYCCLQASHFGACVETIFSSTLFIVFEESKKGNSKDFASIVAENNSQSVRAVYGKAMCLYGALGAGNNVRISTIIPGLNEIIGNLLTIEFGTYNEIL